MKSTFLDTSNGWIDQTDHLSCLEDMVIDEIVANSNQSQKLDSRRVYTPTEVQEYWNNKLPCTRVIL